MKNKKAAWEHLQSLILVILFIVVIGSILYVLINNYGKELGITNCNSWITYQAIKKGATLSFTGVEPPTGYNNDQDTGNLYTDNSPCVTTEEKITEKDVKKPNGVYKKLADNMFYCWRQYGEGKIDFYSNINFGSGNTYCRVCSDIVLEKDVKDQKINIDEFEKFLSTEASPNKVETYAEFFLNAKDAQIELGINELLITKDKHLYSIFAIQKTSSFKETIPISTGLCVAGAKIGFGIGSVFGGVGAPVGGIIGCGIGSGATILYTSDKVPSLLLYQNDPKKLKESCDSVIINLEKNKEEPKLIKDK